MKLRDRIAVRRGTLNRKQWDRELDAQSQTLLGLSFAAFKQGFQTGELDSSDWRVHYLAGLIQ